MTHRPTAEKGLRRLKELAADALELPPEVALDTAKLSRLVGGGLLALNHRGIMVYRTERIVFRTQLGAVEVLGQGLSLAGLNDQTLHITGRIRTVNLPEDCHEA